MDAFIRDWAPVSQWPANQRITAEQAKAALAARGTRQPFLEWRQRFDARHTGVRGPNVSKESVLALFHGGTMEFIDTFPPAEWTTEVLAARLIHRLHRLSTIHPEGIFYQRPVDVDQIFSAFFDLFLEVKKNYSPSKRNRSTIFATIFPETADNDTADTRVDTLVDTPHVEAGGPDTDEVAEWFEGWPGIEWSHSRGDEHEETMREVDEDLAINHDEQASPEMTLHELDEKHTTLRDALTDYPHPVTRQRLADEINASLQPSAPFDSSFGLPSIWSEGLTMTKACDVLGIENREPFYLPGTPPSATLRGYQVQGVAHIKQSLLCFQRAALLDWPGFGKTRQTLLGVERALQSPSVGDVKKPSLVVVPSGAVGEHWIHEGLACTTTLSFVAIGEGFGREHDSSDRVEYRRYAQFAKQGVGKKRFTFFVCTYGTLRKIALLQFVKKAFHAVIIDEMQVLRKWKNSATFTAIDSLRPAWRVGLTATPLMNGVKDIKGFLGFFCDKTLEESTNVAELGNPFLQESDQGEHRVLPAAWERHVDSASVHGQADALEKVAHDMKFVISRNLSTRDVSTGEAIGADVPKLLISRQTVGFHDEAAKAAFASRFNRALDGLWDETNGRKMMRLDKLTDLATMSLSGFAADIPADQKRIAKLNSEHANLSRLCTEVLGRPVSPEEALDMVRSPKLEWLASFLGLVVVSRREKVVLFVLNNREQLLVRAFVETMGIATATFHSGLNAKERSLMISAFNRPGGPPVFIATWGMGSVGFNLQGACCIAVALSLYYNKNAEVQGRCRVHRAGQKRPVLYIQCRQDPSLDTLFMLKHSDVKEIPELYARLNLSRESPEVLERVLEAVIEATVGVFDGEKTRDAVRMDFTGDTEMPEKCIELLQSILAKDKTPYCKNLERM